MDRISRGVPHARVCKVIPVVSILVSLYATAVAAATLVGTTPASFSVSDDGDATYRVPFTLPEGVAGLTPKLGLTYNSNAGDGPRAGAGMSAVYRG